MPSLNPVADCLRYFFPGQAESMIVLKGRKLNIPGFRILQRVIKCSGTLVRAAVIKGHCIDP